MLANNKVMTTITPGKPSPKEKVSSFIFILLLIPILTAHIFHLADIPSGLYLDEASIGYNAFLLADTGRDEHGALLPVYPESVGDYKNPVFVYTAAIFLKIFGVSEFSLRLVSFLFFTTALTLALLLSDRLFQKNTALRLYTLVAFSFLPFFFTISRIAFEVVSQLCWTVAGLLLIWIVFHDGKPAKGMVKAILCGLILGTSTYTYSTGRLLAFMNFALVFIFYFDRENFRKLLAVATSFAVSLIPFLYFTIRSPGAITSRFNSLSYLANSIPVGRKVEIFFNNYITYFSPRFLIFNGDPNLRHSTGFGGVVYISVFLLAMIGLTGLLVRRRWGRFDLFLFAALLLSPIAASLTSEGTPHALRSMTLGVYLFLFSCHGMSECIAIQNRRARSLALTGITLLLFAEIVLYQTDYFLAYPSRSINAMGSQGFESALQFALDQNPGEVIFFNKPRETYAYMQFYTLLADNPDQIPLTWDNSPKPGENICIIYHPHNQNELDSSPLSFKEFDSGGIIRTRCYTP